MRKMIKHDETCEKMIQNIKIFETYNQKQQNMENNIKVTNRFGTGRNVDKLFILLAMNTGGGGGHANNSHV